MEEDAFETERLRLRPFAADLSDLDALHEIQSDAHHMRFYPHPFSREESRAWIERSLDRQERYGYSLWVIEDRRSGEFLGNCGPIPQVIDGDRRGRDRLVGHATPRASGDRDRSGRGMA